MLVVESLDDFSIFEGGNSYFSSFAQSSLRFQNDQVLISFNRLTLRQPREITQVVSTLREEGSPRTLILYLE